MSPKKRRSQKIPFDAKSNAKIDDFFHQLSDKQHDNPSIPQMKKDSRNGPKDVTNIQPQGPKDPQTQGLKDESIIPSKIIHISLDGEHRAHVLKHSDRESFHMGLNSLQGIKEKIEAQKSKEMLVRGMEGIEGYINLGMPLSCFPENSHVQITFVQSKKEQKEENQLFGRHDETTTDCVKFYIHAVGKGKKKIVKCRQLHKEGCKLCVYAFKGETIRDALIKDNRFLPLLENNNWKLIENLNSILESSHLVDDLEGKLFEVEVINRKRKRPKSPAVQNPQSEKRSTRVLDKSIIDQYPSLKREREKIKENFDNEMKERKEANESKKTSLFVLHKTNFGKLTKNSTLVATHKLLSRLSDSVGYIGWDNNGNKGSATCFVFKELYILTCRHVINDIVGEGVDESKWPGIISQCAKVSFSYIKPHENEENCFSVEPWFQVSDLTLDYAILKLKECGQQVPRGLYYETGHAPLSGLIYIIGHPEGDPKSTDACAVIPQGQRTKKTLEYLQTTVAEFCNYDSQFVHMFTQRSFQEFDCNADKITYDTRFFCGASGSPVFDSHGSLVAMHTAGFTYNYQGQRLNMIEFGSSVKSILRDMEKSHGSWFTKVFVNQHDVDMASEGSATDEV